ncbi:GMC family oxidoreductase [Pararobbsia silviterrae]|uniref:Sorbosone dehydrogenase n=1 Tax=Pararobbsia silviterrae TaxID=1792498 RepID=A0A494XSZ9_9BURK|nr:GMC family oxidoreductase N-terminal domain-containing protein [Pararobbsia silviterrae]RKP53727.1 sorbosone dehydrogenase [Pararobbsia silviterrae]
MNQKNTTDYIVIGAGSAGATIAGRLLDRGHSVTVIEAGRLDNHPLMPVPAGFTKLMPTRHLFHYRTTPQDALGGQTRILPQGKVVGGGSSVNAMVYIRGQAADFDDWQAKGASGWSYADVLPYFIRAESNDRFGPPYHGNEGPLGVSDLNYVDTLSRAFVQAAQQAGHSYNPDFNGARQEGVGFCQVTTKDNRRSSAAKAYLHKHYRNPKLRLVTSAFVERIVIEKGRAVAVRYVRDGRVETVHADREIILSAGAIQSPKVLMLSGIGPADALRKQGLDVVLDAPEVGRNFQDHAEVPVIAFCPDDKPVGYFGHDTGLNAVRHGLQFAMFDSGPATSNVVEAHCFADSTRGGGRADVQMQFLPLVYLDLMEKDIIQHAGATINTCVVRPKSRGTIALRSTDPTDDPIIDPAYFSDPDDLERTIRGLEWAREIMRASALQKYVVGEKLPGTQTRTRDDWLLFIKEYAKTVYHPAGTCRMGSDGTAVVDPMLRVNGIDGLRVADASVMPSLTSGNTNAPSIMIGERCADFVLQGRTNP